MTATKPDWYDRGLPHIWLPYTQMKTATPPLAVARPKARASASPTAAS